MALSPSLLGNRWRHIEITRGNETGKHFVLFPSACLFDNTSRKETVTSLSVITSTK